MSLWFVDTSRQALIYFDPEQGGIGFSIPAIEKVGYWKPEKGLDLPLRIVLPRMPQPQQLVQPPNARRH